MRVNYLPSIVVPHLLIFDIETVAETEFFDLSRRKQEAWSHTVQKLINKGTIKPEDHGNFDWHLSNEDERLIVVKSAWSQYACLYPEFGKICSLSIGVFTNKDDNLKFHQKNWTYEQEAIILDNFGHFLDDMAQKGKILNFCGFNIDNFDIPFLSKRYLIVQGTIPEQLNFYGLKPWEINNVDLAKVWQGLGLQDRYMIKLDLLAQCLGIESSKDEMYGGNVFDVFYHEKDLPKIGKYCDKDVKVTANCVLQLSGLPLLT